MEMLKKVFGFKYCGLVVAIGAIMLAFCTVVAFGIGLNGETNEDGDWELKGSKTTTWISPGDYSKGKVEIEADAVAKEQSQQNVLFIGTMCGYHGLALHTIEKSLNASAEHANVDYFFYNNNNPDIGQEQISGTLTKGSNFSIPPSFKNAYDNEKFNAEGKCTKSGLKQENHQALGKFFECIDIQTNKKNYDFIVLEFDGTRISDWYRNLYFSGETQTMKGTYPKYSNEAATVEKLKKYYDNNQVIWITDNEVTSTSEGYRPNRHMVVYGTGDTRTINYNSLKGLLCPDLYQNTDEWEVVSTEHAEEQLNKIPNFNDPVPDEYVLGKDRQVGYIYSSKVAEFINNAIKDLYTYTINFDDVINVDDNITFEESDISLLEYIDSNWVQITDQYDVKYEIDTDAGTVKCSIPNLTGDHKFKLVINFKDKGGGTSFIEQSVDGNPNDGAAKIELTPDAGSGPEPAEPTIPKEKALDWPIEINYKVEDNCVDKDASVSNESDDGIPSIPTDVSKKPGGSNAVIGSSGKYVFVNWTLGENGPEVSTDPNFKPAPDDKYGRYHEATYVAHFKENTEPTVYATITYHVQGAEIAGQANPVIPIDSVTPKDETVSKGTTNYNLKGETPTTSWTTSDGTSSGVPGTWTFYKVNDDVWFTDNTYMEGLSPISKVDKDAYVAYGKWVFTATSPTPDPPAPTPTPVPGNITPSSFTGTQTGDAICILGLALIVVFGSGITLISLEKRRKDR